MMASAIAGLGTLLAAVTVSSAEEIAYEGDVTDIRVVRRLEQHPYAWKIWQPFIIQGDRGRDLLVAFGVQVNGKNDMGDILVSLSRDDGDTWQEPVAVFDHRQRQGSIQFAYANPVLYRAPGQDVIWCFAMRCPIVYRNSEESQLTGAFTADGGRSWTPVEMAMHFAGPLILNAGLVETEIDGRKRYLLPAHRNTLQKDPRGSRDHFILSSSSLLEWKLEAFIPQPTEPRVFLHEGNIAPGDTPGELKIVMRTANYDDDRLTTDPPRAYSSVSRDGGRTWSTAREEPELHNAKSKGFFGQAADGTHIYVYNDGPQQRDTSWPGFPRGGRTSLRYKTKPPGGEWSVEKTFFDAGIKNSYPTLIEVAPGDFRAVWDSGTADTPRTHIRFGRFRLQP
ncbi:MAG: exo-alpha-sialidase [Planctomycetes bacterium]|nr:exo-alpha-sialidase [Planctomycetota bacterium]